MGTEEGLVGLEKDLQRIDKAKKNNCIGRRSELTEIVEGIVVNINYLTAVCYLQDKPIKDTHVPRTAQYYSLGQRTIFDIIPSNENQITTQIIFHSGWIQKATVGDKIRAYVNCEEKFGINEQGIPFCAKRHLSQTESPYKLEVLNNPTDTYKFDRDETKDNEEVLIFKLPDD